MPDQICNGVSSTALQAAVSGTNSGGGIGTDGISENGIGVKGVSGKKSGQIKGVVKLELDPVNNVGVYGNHLSNGHGVFGKSQDWEGIHGETQSAVAAGVAGVQLNPAGTGAGVYAENRGKGHGVFGKSQNWEGVHGETQSNVAAAVAGIQLNPDGTGAGVYAESRGKGPAGFFKGDITVTGDVKLVNADLAEDFDILDDLEVEDGTVMILSNNGSLEVSTKAYDKRIAGVISGAGSYKPAVVLDKRDSAKVRKPIALVGKVYCKVDASRYPIEVGDLLTSSEIPGHAMKAFDPLQSFGAVIGKALKPLNKGKGLIPVLVSLQ